MRSTVKYKPGSSQERQAHFAPRMPSGGVRGLASPLARVWAAGMTAQAMVLQRKNDFKLTLIFSRSGGWREIAVVGSVDVEVKVEQSGSEVVNSTNTQLP